jgi:hypothetical protein
MANFLHDFVAGPLGQSEDARHKFQIALEQNRDPSEQNYLRLCISSIDSEAQRRRQDDAIATVALLKEQADQELSASRTLKATEHLAAASAADPQDMQLALKVAVLQAWFDQPADLKATFQRTAEHASATRNPDDADIVAETGLLRPSTDQVDLQSAVYFARRAVQLGSGHDALPRYQLALGMAQYRTAQYSAADETLTVAALGAKDDPRLPITSSLYRAMTMARLGKDADARALLQDAKAKMRPLPDDEQNPMSGAAPEDLELWLAYKEAKALLTIEPKSGELK